MPADGIPEQIHLTWGQGQRPLFDRYDVDLGVETGKTTIPMRYHHASGADRVPTPNHELFDTLVLEKDRRGRSNSQNG